MGTRGSRLTMAGLSSMLMITCRADRRALFYSEADVHRRASILNPKPRKREPRDDEALKAAAQSKRERRRKRNLRNLEKEQK